MLSFIRRQAPTGFDDKAEFQESELAALKPTLLVAEQNSLEAEICLEKRVKSTTSRASLSK